MITLIIGGARSGKSAVAERLAGSLGSSVTYVATAASPGEGEDPDFARRIQRHRDRRPRTWSTIEAGEDLAQVLEAISGTVLIDSLGTWVARHRDFNVDLAGMCSALTSGRRDVVIVSDEVGMGVHPETSVGRAFRDVLGDVNQAVGALAHDVLLVVAGRTLRISGS